VYDVSQIAHAAHGHRRRRPSGEPPPLPREINRAAYAWLAAFGFFVVIWLSIFLSDGPARVITEWDLAVMDPLVEDRAEWLSSASRIVNGFATHWLTPILAWSTLLVALWFRRVRHVLLLIAALSLINGTVNLVAAKVMRPRPLGVEIIGDWEGFAQPSRPIALLAGVCVAAASSLVPAARRRTVYIVAAVLVVVVGFAQVYTAVDHPSDVLAGATVGVAFALLLYLTVAPDAVFPISYGKRKSAHLDITGARGDAIRRGLAGQLNIDVEDIRPIGLEGSAGSTPLRIATTGGELYFAKLYARTHLRADRSYKLWRTLVYGRLEDEQHFTSVRRLVQHEDYMVHVMRRVGVPCAEPKGIVEITPDREYLLVTEFLTGAVEIGETEIDDTIIDEGLEAVARMWRSGLAHRDIKPANLMVQRGHLRIIDVGFGQIRPSPWRQAVDLANMMLVLSLRSSPEIVYERARQQFSEDEIAEAFAASRGVTLPSGLRRDLRADGRDHLERFRELAPEHQPVSIQRWSLRRVALMAWVVLIAFAVASMFFSNLADVGLR
jgi:tRNA A-37 threonylcarbamoyl transferase component Bud32/membrane-associated phospholipid phosphatase